jgi:hypothetical protein
MFSSKQIAMIVNVLNGEDDPESRRACRQQILTWISPPYELFEPTANMGRGTGRGHRFSFMQSLGILVAIHVFNSERGCVSEYVGKIIRAFENWDESELLAELKQEHTRFVKIGPDGKPVLRTPDASQVDHPLPDLDDNPCVNCLAGLLGTFLTEQEESEIVPCTNDSVTITPISTERDVFVCNRAAKQPEKRK